MQCPIRPISTFTSRRIRAPFPRRVRPHEEGQHGVLKKRSTEFQYTLPTIFSLLVASIGMTSSSAAKGILTLSFNNHLVHRGFPFVPDPLQTVVSQATKVGNDLATEATRVTDQASSLISSATAAVDHLVDQLLPRAVTVGTNKACFDFGHEKCYGLHFMQPLLWLCFSFFVLACALVTLAGRRRRLSLHFAALGFGILAWVSSLVSAFFVILVHWTAKEMRQVSGGSLKRGSVFNLAFASVAVAAIHLFLGSRALIRFISTGWSGGKPQRSWGQLK